MKALKTAALLIGGLWILFELAWMTFQGPSVPVGPADTFFDALVLLGGPAALILGTLAAVKWDRQAGAFLWLGAAVASLGLGFKSGTHVGRYFLAMAVVVLPQVVEGSLLLMAAKRRDRAQHKAAVPR